MEMKGQKSFSYTAVGDSLTEGVGDLTNQGGFVPLLSKKIENKYNVSVTAQNFGHAGDTSSQEYNKIKKSSQIQTALKKADFITITVGGNDVVKVIRENTAHLSTLTVKDFKKPAKAYQKQLAEMFDLIRSYNKTAHIYVIGVYNPFYLNFPDITAIQDVISLWNDSTESVVAKEKKMSFVAINDQIYKGINNEDGVTADTTSTDISNDALFTGDHFHPNNVGYQIMANAVFSDYQKVNKK